MVARPKLNRANFRGFLSFAVVGAVGSVVNLGMYYAVRSGWGLNATVSATLAFLVAVTGNYIGNQVWTFRHSATGLFGSVGRYSSYVLCNIGGLSINLIALNVIILVFGARWDLLGQLLGVTLGMSLNYRLASALVFVTRPSSK
jgi:dolichol-phosphate mannosyltransferase